MYNFNFTRGENEATHNHLHQIENVLGYHDSNAELDKALFDWEGNTVDQDDKPNQYGHLINTGSWANACGDSHWVPNVVRDPGNANTFGQEYNWDANQFVTTNCSDWNPQGTGSTENINCSAWNCDELDYYIWWMQRIPGDANGLVSDDGVALRNWWQTIARYDEVKSGPSVLLDYGQ